MAAIIAVFTVARVAQTLGESEDWLHDLAIDMFAEDGCLWVYGPHDQTTLAFTQLGIENLQGIIAIHRAAGTAPPPLSAEW